jgi:uncharacterized paraquat-inducible protein A
MICGEVGGLKGIYGNKLVGCGAVKTRNQWPYLWLVYPLLLPVALVSIKLRSRMTLAAGVILVWILVSVLIIVTGVINIKRRRWWQRYYAGQCVRCGYDLRATPDRCPECGVVPFNLKKLPAKGRAR